MKPFRRTRTGYTAVFEPQEAGILGELAGQVASLLQAHDENVGDPALARLLPDAYPGDAEASAEFRRFTTDGLVERKVQNAMVVLQTVGEATSAATATRVLLTADEAQAWLRTITDIRLSLATRLGISNEDDDSHDRGPHADGDDADSPDAGIVDVYDWLAFVQDSLVRALDR
ncbi:MAG: hypothetical protein JWO10_332 [Microbacteriaceae bacterium]|nr:hypothetical protein [Microbacteriaceae bacterium]